MRKFEERLIFWIGFYLFALGIAAVMYSIKYTDTANFLWFSYVSLLLIGVGMMWGNSSLILMQLTIILIPVLIWDIDFILNLFGFGFLGITDYYFHSMSVSWGKFIALEHLYVAPLALWAVWKLGIKRKDIWKWSFLEVGIIWFLSLVFTDPARNVNCVVKSCVGFVGLDGLGYYFAWFLVVGGIICLVNWGLLKLFYRKYL